MMVFAFVPLKSHLEYFDIPDTYMFLMLLIFFISIATLLEIAINDIYAHFTAEDKIDIKNLDQNERKILCFFVMNEYQNADLLRKHIAIVKLKNRNLLKYVPLLVYVGYSPYSLCNLTEKAKKKIKNKRFQKKIFSGLDRDEVYGFINTIAEDRYP